MEFLQWTHKKKWQHEKKSIGYVKRKIGKILGNKNWLTFMLNIICKGLQSYMVCSVFKFCPSSIFLPPFLPFCLPPSLPVSFPSSLPLSLFPSLPPSLSPCFFSLFHLSLPILTVGEALCYELSKHGAKLIMSARSEAKMETIRNSLKNPDRAKSVTLYTALV